MEINKEFLGKLFEQAVENPRLRQSYDLRTTSDDNSQRILNTLLPGTVVPIHRHPNSNENVLLLCGKLVEVIYNENGKEKERIHLDPTIGNYGCVIPPGAWHTVEVLEPSVIQGADPGSFEKMTFPDGDSWTVFDRNRIYEGKDSPKLREYLKKKYGK